MDADRNPGQTQLSQDNISSTAQPLSAVGLLLPRKEAALNEKAAVDQKTEFFPGPVDNPQRLA
ncbi:hypothetical protein ABU178_13185 [Pantoea osteomyelitidis]|uniref:Uncharacterized protein n=1 Tax=Pantoea osteomyelitidis TaxID=3230026 RepID=A0ABW7PXR2_9GAMM